MSTVNLTNLGFFNSKRVALLNDLAAVNKRLMPHVVAAAIGCKLSEAMVFLLFLYSKEMADGYLLIYHAKHSDVNFAKRPIKSGLPKSSELVCQICEEEINLESDLLYDFEFIIKRDVTFNL